jgi:hypothetical protein
MNRTTRIALIALAVLGVYLFGVMTGAVGVPLAQRVAGVVFGTSRVAFGPGMMADRYADVRDFDRGPGMMWNRDGSGYDRALPDDSRYQDCPHWDEDATPEDSTSTPGVRPFGRGMMPPGSYPR